MKHICETDRGANWLLNVAPLLVAVLIGWMAMHAVFVASAQASGFNCQNPTYSDGRKCNTRLIAIDTIIHYYDINKARSHRNYGCNWYRVLRAFDKDGKFVPSHSNSRVRGRPKAPDMDTPPADLTRTGCAVDSPMTVGEARANQRNWSGWSPVAAWLAAEARRTTKECPNGSIIDSSQQCPEPPEMLTCWDGSSIRYQPSVWHVTNTPQQAREAQRRADCPPRPAVTPTITLSVGPDVTEGKAHTWTLHASEAADVDLDIRVDFRGAGNLVCNGVLAQSCNPRNKKSVAMFGRMNIKQLGNGVGEVYQGGQHFTLPAGQTSVSFAGMGSSNDFLDTGDGTVTGIVGAGQGYVLGTPSSVSAKVLDDDGVAASTVTINMPTVTVREGKWATVSIATPSQGGQRRCVTGRVTLTPYLGSQPDSSDYRTYFLDREIMLCSSIRGDAWFGYVQAYRDSHNDGGERLILGFTQTGGDGTAHVTEGSVTITNDGPLPADYLAHFGHAAAGDVTESVAGRMAAPRLTHGAAAWGRRGQSSFSARALSGDQSQTSIGADYRTGDWLMGILLTEVDGEGMFEGYDLGSDLLAVVPYIGYRDVWAAAGGGKGAVSLSRGHDDYEADTDWLFAGAGGRHRLLGDGVLSLSSVWEAWWQELKSERVTGLEGASAGTYRLRAGAEVRVALSPRLAVRGTMRVRHEGGDIADDTGLDLGAGADLALGGLRLSGNLSQEYATDADRRAWSVAASYGTAWGEPYAKINGGTVVYGWRYRGYSLEVLPRAVTGAVRWEF